MLIRFPRLNRDFDLSMLPSLVVFLLCFYFGFHLMQGQHSVWSYFSNQSLIAEKQETLSRLQTQSGDLEEDVTKLRVDTLDADFLKERARYLLGYMTSSEIMLVPEEE